MSDIRQWLDELGLSQYADAFVANDIDLRALPELSDADLKDIGVNSLGHRRVILGAIKKLREAPPPTAGGERTEGAPPREREAERRQLTVMFCDLVGSTALSEKLDPEDLREVMQSYQQVAGAVIERYDGHVAQYLGDGLMTYFGWPQAHEDDAQRAVRAGMDIVDAVKAINAPYALSVRIGIATGPVVVGETGGGDPSVAKTAVGETPNLAARIQGLADGDCVVIGSQTRRLVAGAFDLQSLGDKALKGVTEPLELFQVRGEAAAESRFEAQAIGGLTPFVGRDAEIAMLLERWAQTKEGEGQVVLLEGEPGIGKSRIIKELSDTVAAEPHIRLRYQCSPYYVNSAFYPVIDQLERAAGFARDDSTDSKLDKLEAVLAQGTDDVPRVAALIAAMLSLPVDRYPALDLSPQRQKDETIAAMAAQVAGLAQNQPVLFFFEDSHWCDPTTIEALTAVIASIESVPVLMVITYRPEFDPPWTGHGHVVSQRLSRLARRQGADMVGKVTGGKPLPDEVRDQIVAKTDGVPLFVEELTKTVLEAGFLKDVGGHYELDGPLPPLAIPTTLQDSLMARLDRLSPVKEVAQIGACIGREFGYELLATVSPLRDNELQDALQQLVNSELIFRRGTATEASYTFKHALVQDAAYESLLKSKRQRLHTTIAKVLEDQFPTVPDTEPELLAFHYSKGSLPDLAAPYWLQAGRLALSGFALPESITHLKRGLAEIAKMEESKSRDRLELELRKTLGSAYIAMLGWTAPEVRSALEPAYQLAIEYNDNFGVLSAGWNLWVHHAPKCEFDLASRYIRELTEFGVSRNDGAIRLVGQSAAAMMHIWQGQFSKAQDPYESVCRSYRIEAHGDLVFTLNHDPLAVTMGWIAISTWICGYPERAVALSRESVDKAETIGHPFNHCFSLFQAMTVWNFVGDLEELRREIDITLQISREHNLLAFEHFMVPTWEAQYLIRAGDVQTGYDLITQSYEFYEQTGGSIGTPLTENITVEALLSLGNPEAALTQINDTIRVSADQKQLTYIADSHRIKGDILGFGLSRSDEAEQEFMRALDLARDQGAKSWELRVATSLARLWKSQSKTAEALDVLAPVYDWFTEGFDTGDLKAAKALLDQLR